MGLKNLFFNARGAERLDTLRLYDRAEALYGASHLGAYHASLDDIASEVLAYAMDVADLPFDPEHPVTAQLQVLARDVFSHSELYGFPAEKPETVSGDLERASQFRQKLQHKITLYTHGKENHEIVTRVADQVVATVLAQLSPSVFVQATESDYTLNVPFLDFCDDIGEIVETLTLSVFVGDAVDQTLFERLCKTLDDNVKAVSGITSNESTKPVLWPSEALKKGMSAEEIAQAYLARTPFLKLFDLSIPYAIPESTRFEHTHIVGGSGHGKTQLLQQLICADIGRAIEQGNGFCVIDSQGDLISNITHLAAFAPESGLADRLLIIDPNDIEHPLSLNMFDMHLEHSKDSSPVEQEKILNGTIELYEYIFNSLLGAELTQRQSVIFNYIARAMLVIPDANIITLRDFIEHGEMYREHLKKLDATAQHFFDTQFFTKTYDQTRKQILTRLWGVLSNPVFERMFSAPKNKVDMFRAMNEGKIVLINTAKDLLKTDGCSIFGRFFIALIVQAALSRAVIAPTERRAFFVYIDEAQDYFDNNIDNLLAQARKYSVGLTCAHQSLSQTNRDLRASMMTNMATKIVGGLSSADATSFSKEMMCDPDLIRSVRKRSRFTEFVCSIRNHTPRPVKLRVPFGVMEDMERLEKTEFVALLQRNRQRVSYEPQLPESKEVKTETPDAQNAPPPPTTGKKRLRVRVVD